MINNSRKALIAKSCIIGKLQPYLIFSILAKTLAHRDCNQITTSGPSQCCIFSNLSVMFLLFDLHHLF